MPGWSNADNKFGLTPFIVGQVLGDGCNYDTIQTAIDECFAAGGGVVGIRSSPVPYVENLTLRAGVDLYGFDVDGRTPSFLSKVVIQGNHTFTQAGGFGAVIAQYINFPAPTGDVFTLSATGGGAAILAMKFSGIEAFTVAGQRAIAMNPDAAASCQFSTDNTQIQSDSHCFENIGLGSGSAFLSLGVTNSSTGSIMHNSGGGSISITGQWTTVSASLSVMDSVIGNGGANFTHSDINTSGESFLLGAGGGSANVTHCIVGSSAASGNWIDGPAGVTVTFGDILLASTAQNIGAAVLQNKVNWQPYTETALTALGSNRGTASFDSASFAVTDGFVQATGNIATAIGTDSGVAVPIAGVFNIFGGAGVTTIAAANDIYIRSVEYTDVAGPTLAAVDNGYFDTAGTTITLPLLPAHGEQVRVISVNSPTVIQASLAQVITIGNVTSSPGGASTGTDTGDCLVLVYNLPLDRWIAESVLGNWTLS